MSPFASVDAKTHADLEDLLLRIQQETGVTVVFVTHDIDEAIYLGHRVLVLSNRPTVMRETLDVPCAEVGGMHPHVRPGSHRHRRAMRFDIGETHGVTSPVRSVGPVGYC